MKGKAPAASDGVVVTDDGALFFPPSSLGSGMERGGTLLVKKGRVVGYQDDHARAAVPRSRPREHRAAGARDSGGESRGGDSGDRPRPSGDDEEAEPPGLALPGRAMSAPKLVLVVELEHRVWGWTDVASEGEERRLLYDLAGRDVLAEIIDALADLVERLEAT